MLSRKWAAPLVWVPVRTESGQPTLDVRDNGRRFDLVAVKRGNTFTKLLKV